MRDREDLAGPGIEQQGMHVSFDARSFFETLDVLGVLQAAQLFSCGDVVFVCHRDELAPIGFRKFYKRFTLDA